ncbi:hypothetical protein KIW84_061441 [Lathyrus oleraceus]|uniref:Uncharacterized protein n=1 Tax=Pisum sativum TaxID=3888 RepID=A0A9D5A486_PEA|nr:hypothetical protein KIW84_061441 [Pisum sativum]
MFPIGKRKLPRRYAKEFMSRTRGHLFSRSFGWKQFLLFMEQKEPTILRAYTSLCLTKSGTLKKSEILESLKNSGLPANKDNVVAKWKEGPSCASLTKPVAILSISALVFGSIAILITGSGKSIRSSTTRLTGSEQQFHIFKLLWFLVSFSKKSIPEMYSLLIRKRSCQAALDFAARHGLDKDEVLKSQAGPTEDAVKDLLAYGPRITDHHRFSEVDDDDSSHVWDVRLARLQILQFRDRLETLLGINMGRFLCAGIQ